MTGRVYLDWNASAPLRPEARAAMLAAMDVVGNPSSVHAEGRAAKAIVEKARGQVAGLVGCEPSEVVFTSGATEAARTILNPEDEIVYVFMCPGAEHDCVVENASFTRISGARVTRDGLIELSWPTMRLGLNEEAPTPFLIALTAANGETGVRQGHAIDDAGRESEIDERVVIFSDTVQAVGKAPFVFRETWIDYAAVSAHKIGGSKGCGALILGEGLAIEPLLRGGGQEQGRRSGTENVIGIAGFGAAAEAAQRDLESGAWDRVAVLRDNLEDALAGAAPDLHIFGKDVPRLPNTSCFAVPGWNAETQVMQMDLAGYAVSAGSACSSGKVNKASRVLLAMGFDEVTASSAIRVSIGPTTSEAEVMGFADTWIEHYRRRRERAA